MTAHRAELPIKTMARSMGVSRCTIRMPLRRESPIVEVSAAGRRVAPDLSGDCAGG
jgi:hypothetical protein